MTAFRFRSTGVTCGLLTVALVLFPPPPARAASEEAVAREVEGLDSTLPATKTAPDSTARRRALALLGSTGLLLIPESTNDRVMAFDPATGDLVDPDFIPSDPTHLSTPIHAIAGFGNSTILVSDQLEDAVFEYDAFTGNFIRLFAPAGGADPDILDNIRGMALSGELLVTVAGGLNANAIASFDNNGNYLGNVVANGAGGLDSPFDLFVRLGPPIDGLVSGINSDTIHSYDEFGNPNPPFATIDTFPEQIYEIPGSGNVLVGNFSGTEEGVVEYDSTGVQVGIYNPASLGGYRGVYELANGNILTTTGGGVHEIDRLNNLIESKITGVSARFIEWVELDFEIFSDGFESGDLSAWSGSVP